MIAPVRDEPERPRILVVDDEEPIRTLLVEHLAATGYWVASARDGAEGLDAAGRDSVDLVLSDIRMPGMDGLELLEKLALTPANPAVILLTACEDVATAVRAMKLGASDYLLKPCRLDQVSATVRAALERRREERELAVLLRERSLELERLANDLQSASERTLDALVAALDAREQEAGAHSRRVSQYAVALGEQLGMHDNELGILRRGALLHDIGKIGIPDAILSKNGELTQEEWRQMRRHPQIGYHILNAVGPLQPAAELVLTHHLNYDGTGYPLAWRGQEIPVGSRTFAVVDAFDAMTSDRPYRKSMGYAAAVVELVRCAGRQFDPVVVRAFLAIPRWRWEKIASES